MDEPTALTAADVLALADTLNWPRVQLAPAVSVGPGEQSWVYFTVRATPQRLQQAHAALTALPKNPPEPLSPRLV